MTQHDMSDFAYVTLLMKGDFYVPGCLVLASSLRRAGNKEDIICMVTSDVSTEAQSVLSMLFTEVIPVDYITTSDFQMSTEEIRQRYGDMSTSILTKLNCMNLKGKLKDKQKQYKKVCLLDADLLVLRCMDTLFSLEAPAGTFHSYWLHGTHDPYPRNMKTGDIVPRNAIQEALDRKRSYVVQTTVLLFPTTLPSGEDIFSDFQDYIQQFSKDTGDLGLSNLLCNMYNTIDDLTVSTYFHNSPDKWKWTYIGHEYTCIPWKDNCANPYVYHYFHNKPWTMQESTWSDLKPWFDEARWIHANYPQTHQFFKFLVGTTSTEYTDNGKLETLLVRLKHIGNENIGNENLYK